MKALLCKIMNGNDLTEEEAADMLAKLSETNNYAQAGALLAALEIKGESVTELTGAARYLRKSLVRLVTCVI